MKRKKKRAGTSTSRATAETRRKLWVNAMLENGGNQTKAAVSAGSAPGKAAEKYGERMAKDPRATKMLEERRAAVLAAIEERTEINIAETLRELSLILRSDLRKVFDEDGALLPPSKWPDDVAAAVQSVKVVELAGGMKIDMGEEGGGVQHIPMYTKEVKLWDKVAAIDKAMRHLGLFEADNKQKPPATVAVGVLTVGLNFKEVLNARLPRTLEHE